MVRSPVGSLMRHVQSLVSADAPDAELLRRFAADREQEAFAALVRRHGRLVWGVCRRTLPREHDAEDAFQAVFLVLAKKAASLRHGELVSGWLYGVAYRVAHKAKALAARRLERERRAAVPESLPERDLAWRELQAILDDELVRLPEKYRVPFVLCCLEGRSREEAEAELGWKRGTVSSRIAEARRLLEQRLARRGVSLAAALTAKALWERTGSAAVPALGDGASAAAVALANGFTASSSVRLLLGAFVAMAGVTAAVAFSGQPARPAAVGEAVAAPGGVDRHGDPLPPGAIARLGTVRFRHGDWVRSIGFTPDGQRVVSHGWGDGIRVWDAATGREVASLPMSGVAPAASALVKSGEALIVSEPDYGTSNTFVRVLTFPGLKLTREFTVTVHIHCISPDGKLVAGYGQNNGKGYIAEIWEVATGKRLHSWVTGQHEICCKTFTPDGKYFVTGGDKCVRFWDVKTAKLARDIADLPGLVQHFAISPDGAKVATLGMTRKKTGPLTATLFPDNFIRLWDVPSGKLTQTVKMDAGTHPTGEPIGFGKMAFAPDGRSLVSVGGDYMLRFWDVATGKEQRRVPLVRAGVGELVFSPDVKTLAVCSRSVRLIDVATGKDKLDLAGVATVNTADVSPDGRAVVTLGDGTVALWDAASGRERGRISPGKKGISAVRLLDDGRSLVGVGEDNQLRVWDAKTLTETLRIPVKVGPAYWPLFDLSPDRKSAVVQVEKGKTLALLDLTTGQERGRIVEAEEDVVGAAFTPDGRSLVYWGADHFAHVWDLKAGKKTLRFEFHKPSDKHPRRGWPYAARLSPDGRLIAYGAFHDKCLALHEVATGKVVRVIDNLPLGAETLAFTSDGRTLAWGSYRSIHITELASGQERHRLDGHRGRVYSLKFAADGSTLVSSSQDGTGLVWDVFGRSDTKSPLAPKELDACWADLAGDTARAFEAMRKMLRSPDETASYLAKRVRPVPEPDPKRIAGWVADLDSDRFERRKAATAELEKLCELASAECRRALTNRPSLEARKRLERLLAAVEADERAPSPERIRALRAVELLDRIGTPAARRSLAELATGAPGARLTREAKASRDRAR
jgi:RNA polymerase sigma factor (sigma-70 family)